MEEETKYWLVTVGNTMSTHHVTTVICEHPALHGQRTNAVKGHYGSYYLIFAMEISKSVYDEWVKKEKTTKKDSGP